MSKKVTPGRIVNVEALGLCEHCGTLQDLTNLPMDAIDAEWVCGVCKKTLTMKSFGYEDRGEDCEKTRWVGPGKKWVKEKCKDNFNIGNLLVIPESPKSWY